MAKAIVQDYGKVDFDEMDYDNNFYDLWCVCICEDEQVVKKEYYISQDEYRDAVYGTPGRELMAEREEPGFCYVRCGGVRYDCECEYHYAYVIDHDEE